MRSEPLQIDDSGPQEGRRILRLNGPLILSNIFHFQSLVRADASRQLILDFTNVPYVDSVGIGALVGAYVTRQREGRSLALVGVNKRVRDTLEITRVQQFFNFYDTVPDAEKTATVK